MRIEHHPLFGLSAPRRWLNTRPHYNYEVYTLAACGVVMPTSHTSVPVRPRGFAHAAPAVYAGRPVVAVRPGVMMTPAALGLPAGTREPLAGYEVFVALGLPWVWGEARE